MYQLISSLQTLIHPFIQSAETSVTSISNGHNKPLLEYHDPLELSSILKLELPANGVGKEGTMKIVEKILKYSVNTWDRGFMDKLYESTNAVCLIYFPFPLCAKKNISSIKTNRAIMIERTGRRPIRAPPQHLKHKCPRLQRQSRPHSNRKTHNARPRRLNRL